jgi:arylformamidase
MSRRFVDISMPLVGDIPTWPGSIGLTTSALSSIAAGDEANVTRVEMDVHTGTHVDAPLHFVPDGKTLGEVGLDPFVGPAYVVDVTGTAVIDAATLEGAQIPDDTTRLLLRTDNSFDPKRHRAPFDPDYAALSKGGAQWVVDRGIRLVGIDYMSIQRHEDSFDTHRVILGAGTVIVEGLRLADARPGRWILMCLPVNLAGAEAAPARAVLLPEGSWDGG